jgi:hypothetical protein
MGEEVVLRFWFADCQDTTVGSTLDERCNRAIARRLE